MRTFIAKYPNAILFGLSLFISIIVLAVYLPQNQIWEGGADNYWHYFFSKYCYKYPKYFLHHWGKPIFTFLSAPFSQFGFIGLSVFNAICGVTAAFYCFKFCNALKLKNTWIAGIMLLYAPGYFVVIQSGLTEPLFSLLLIAGAYYLYSGNYVLACIIISFLPYSRTEGSFIIVWFLMCILLLKQWKFTPFLLTGFLIYSFAGYFSGHDFLWFFTENPYHLESQYGHGAWSHFFVKYDYIFGLPHLIALVIGFLFVLKGIFKEKSQNLLKVETPEIKVLLLVFAPAAMYYFFHVYAWGAGKFASAGLERVIAAIIPLTSIVGVFGLNHIGNFIKNNYLKNAFLLLFMFFSIKAAFKFYHYPVRGWGSEYVEREAALWFKERRIPDSDIYYGHPGIVFFADYDPFAPENKECWGLSSDCKFNFTKPTYIFWDSMFSGGCVKLEELQKCNNLKMVKSLSDMDFSLYVFEYIPEREATNIN